MRGGDFRPKGENTTPLPLDGVGADTLNSGAVVSTAVDNNGSCHTASDGGTGGGKSPVGERFAKRGAKPLTLRGQGKLPCKFHFGEMV